MYLKEIVRSFFGLHTAEEKKLPPPNGWERTVFFFLAIEQIGCQIEIPREQKPKDIWDLQLRRRGGDLREL